LKTGKLNFAENMDRLSEAIISERLFGLGEENASPGQGYLKQKSGLLRAASVLIPLVWIGNEWHVLFIKRTNTVSDHKDQVAFPGGVREVQDSTPEDTALREMFEEIGVLPKNVRILGKFPHPIELTNYQVYPIVGTFDWPYSFHLSPEEVSCIFTIPLAWLSAEENREMRIMNRAGKDYPVIFYKPFKDQILWGASARMVVNLIEALNEKD
jgi:8-oxo-dGTP pyrophosphatase MutT (NUDIX family)